MSDVPKQLGKYQIRRAIGKGAMGIVYEGLDPIIDRVVAIKTIKMDELDHEEAEEHKRRFLIEAKAAGRLNHKNIVGIYDYGEEKGLSFIVMEFVQGKELKSFFASRHPFSMSQIVRLMSELLDALGYSHSRGVVHRDIKPDNIFITEEGSVKLGDFGIARIDSTSKTHAGTVLGTPSYMAPEQIRGETADARSDLYAAGVILYQFLVGERPFSGGMVAVMQKVLMEAPKPPSTHNPSIPESIDAVVLKALAKAAGDRFVSAAEFSRELTAAVGLADAQDESESTMIMSSAQLKALQEGAVPTAERTGVGSTHTGTGTGTGTGGTGATGPAGRSSVAGGRGAAVEEAKRRAEEAKRRYEEDLKRAEVELQQAEAEQRAAEAEAQSQADTFMAASQSLLDESATLQSAAQALFTQNTLLLDGQSNAVAARAVVAKMRETNDAIGAFIAASYALAPAAQATLEERQGQLAAATAAHESLVERVEREGRAALSGFEQKLEVLEKRLAGQYGAWGSESRALESLDAAAGEEAIAPIQARLDKLATSVDQVGKGLASVQAQSLKLPQPHAERLAVVEAQLAAQNGFVARLRAETEAARERVRAAAEARRKAEEAARLAAQAEAARKKAEDEARAKAEAEAAAERKRVAEEQARREAEERARREAESAEQKRLADEKARAEAAAAAALKKAELEAAAEKKRLADEAAAKAEADRRAAEAQRKAAEAAESARLKAEEDARKKAESEAKKQAQAEAKRQAEEAAKQKAAEAAQRKADEEARKKADAEARRQAEAEAKARSEAAAKEKAALEAKRKADEEAARLAQAKALADAEAARAREAQAAAAARLDDGDPDATMVGRKPAPHDEAEDGDDDAESTMMRPAKAPAPAPKPAPAPAPAPAPTVAPETRKAAAAAAQPAAKKSSMMLPIAGAAVVVVAAGAWFALRPSSAPTSETPAAAPTVSASAAPAPAPASTPSPAPVAPPVDKAAAAKAAAAEKAAAAKAAAAKAAADKAAADKLAADKAAAAKAAAAAAKLPANDPGKAKADAEAKAKADAVVKAKADADAKARADADAKAKADAAAKAKADADAKAKADADAKAKADADAKAKAQADAAAAKAKADADAAAKQPAKADPKQEAADAFRKGLEAYQSGRVSEGIRQMERADAAGAPGARAQLCAIYRKPTAAEGKDFVKEANKCKGVD